MLLLFQKSRVQVWLYEQVNLRLEGCIAVSDFFKHCSYIWFITLNVNMSAACSCARNVVLNVIENFRTLYSLNMRILELYSFGIILYGFYLANLTQLFLWRLLWEKLYMCTLYYSLFETNVGWVSKQGLPLQQQYWYFVS